MIKFAVLKKRPEGDNNVQALIDRLKDIIELCTFCVFFFIKKFVNEAV